MIEYLKFYVLSWCVAFCISFALHVFAYGGMDKSEVSVWAFWLSVFGGALIATGIKWGAS